MKSIQDKLWFFINNRIAKQFGKSHKNVVDRLTYVFEAQQRFYQMVEAWKAGNIEQVGQLFRLDGIGNKAYENILRLTGLRDLYKISGPELEAMCDIVRTVPGVFGERMLGGGDKVY